MLLKEGEGRGRKREGVGRRLSLKERVKTASETGYCLKTLDWGKLLPDAGGQRLICIHRGSILIVYRYLGGRILRKYITVLLLLNVCILFAGPFGVDMGWSLEQLEQNTEWGMIVDQEGRNTTYATFYPPKSHDAFVLYYFKCDEEYGVHQITAITANIQLDSFGSSLISKHKELSRELTSVYGPPSPVLQSPVLTKGPSEEFVEALMRGEKPHYIWDLYEEVPTHPEEPEWITLGIELKDAQTAFIRLTYVSHDSVSVADKQRKSDRIL